MHDRASHNGFAIIPLLLATQEGASLTGHQNGQAQFATATMKKTKTQVKVKLSAILLEDKIFVEEIRVVEMRTVCE